MWKRLTKFFKHSETIFWARVQALFGAVAIALTYVDAQIVTEALPDNWAVWFLLFNGVATEYLRRRRATFPDDADDYPHENL